MGRPPKVSRPQLQRAALAIADEGGLAALTMRSLARRVGAAPMTLYNHVADRADLDVLLVDAVMDGVELPQPGEGAWEDEVTAIATAAWRAVRAHPEVIGLVLTRRSRSAAVMDLSEALLAALARGGRGGDDLLHAFRAVTAYATGFAQAELANPLTAAVEPPGETIARVLDLPVEKYPHLRAAARTAARSEPEREFAAGLAALLRGLGAERDRPRKGGR